QRRRLIRLNASAQRPSYALTRDWFRAPTPAVEKFTKAVAQEPQQMVAMGLYRSGVGGGRLLGLLRPALSPASRPRQECQCGHHHYRPGNVPDQLYTAQRKERFLRNFPRSLRSKID